MPCPRCTCAACMKARRSKPQNDRIHALCEAAYQHWPRGHAFKPESKEHLRAWLLCKAGHVKVVDRDGEMDEKLAREISLMMAAVGRFVWVKSLGDKYLLITPETTRFSDLPHKEACRVFSEVDEILCDIFQLTSTDQLLRAMEKAA
jgi:hypothetical protein